MARNVQTVAFPVFCALEVLGKFLTQLRRETGTSFLKTEYLPINLTLWLVGKCTSCICN